MATTVFDLQAILGIDTSKFDRGLSEAKTKASSFGSTVSKGVGTALKAGVAAIGAATTAVVGFGAKSVKTGAEFDKAMSQVAATMGVTTDSIENLRDFAREMGRETKFTATEAAEALNYMALAGYDAETSIGMLPNVLNLAAAGSMDLARASDMITDTQTAFGISLERTTTMVDEMAKAASTGNTSVEQLGDAFLTVGGLAQELNGGMITLKNGASASVDGVQELEIALTAMANAGIKGSEAGTHMRNMLLKLSSPTDAGTKQLEQLGVTVFDTEGKMRSLSNIFGDLSKVLGDLTQEQKIQAISDLFNTRDLASAEALLNAVGQDWNEIGEAIKTAWYTEESLNDSLAKMLGGTEALDKMKASFEEMGISAEDWDTALKQSDGSATALLDCLVDLTDEEITQKDLLKQLGGSYDILQNALDRTTGSAEKMRNEQLNNLAGDVDILKSAFSDLQIEISDGVSPTLRKFTQLGIRELNNLTAIVSGFDASPYIDEMGRMTEEGAKAQAEFKEQQKKAMEDLFQGISEGVEMVVQNIPVMIEYGGKLLSSIGQGLLDSKDTLIDTGIQIAGYIGEFIVDGLPQALDFGLDFIEKLFESITNNKETIKTKAHEFITNLSNILAEHIQGLSGEDIGDFADIAISIMGDLAQALIDALPVITAKIPEIVNGIVQAFQNNPEAMSAIGTLWGLKMAGSMTTSLLGNLGSTLLSQLSTFMTANVGATISAGGMTAGLTMGAAIVGGVFAFFAGAEIGKQIGAMIFPNDADLYESYSGIEGTWQMLKDLAVAIVDDISMKWDSFKTKTQEIAQAVKTAWNMLKEGVVTIVANIATAVIEKWNSIKTSIQSVIDNIRTVVQNGFNALVSAIRSALGNAKSAVTEAFNTIKNTIKTVVDGAKAWGHDLMDNFIGGIRDKINAVRETASSVADSVKSFLHFSVPDEGPLSDFDTYAPDMMQLFIDGISGGEGSLKAKLAEVFNFDAIFESIFSKISNFAGTLGADVGEPVSSLGENIGQSLSGITTFITTFLGNIKQIFVTKWQEIVVSVTESIQKIFTSVQEKFNAIRNTITNVISSIKTNVVSGFSNMATSASSALNALRSVVSSAFDNIKSIIMGVVNSAKTWGSDLMNNFTDGVRGKIDSLKAMMSEVANSVKNVVGFSEPKEGPLSNFHTYAPDMMNLFMQGIKAGEDELQRTVADAFDFRSIMSDNVIKAPTVTSNVRNGGQDKMISLLQEIRDKNMVVVLEGDADRLFRVMQSKATANYRITGHRDLVTV